MAFAVTRGGHGGGKPPGKGPSQPGRGHTAAEVSIREKLNNKAQNMLSWGRSQVGLIIRWITLNHKPDSTVHCLAEAANALS